LVVKHGFAVAFDLERATVHRVGWQDDRRRDDVATVRDDDHAAVHVGRIHRRLDGDRGVGPARRISAVRLDIVRREVAALA
jgi:hypothetical protein